MIADEILLPVLERAAGAFGLRRAELFRRQRTATVALARQCAMYALHRELGFTQVEVGAVFDRNHSTVIWAVRAVERELATGRPARVGLVRRALGQEVAP